MEQKDCPARVGEKIPEFSADAYHQQEIKRIRHSSFKGKWLILVFYPADFTFVCPTELKEFSEHYQSFQKLGAEVLSISTDSVYVHKAWQDSSPTIKKIPFPMLADPTGDICKAFGTYVKGEGISLRATFIVDPEGFIQAMEMHDIRVGRSVTEILRKFQACRFVYENPDEVCPAGWEPGKNTIKPNMDLIGKL
ncbi:MAG TPA: peroxiredoxin [Candidatus Woesearchaeota archaeon]|nr:peroxiredoxin [Candidatus Woesearchaeota archaeon]